MTAFIKRFAAPLFFATMMAFIAGGLLKNEWIQIITKPLLLPILMGLVFVSTPPSTSRTLMLVALFFSFAGDVFLLFETSNAMLFIPGLVSFLLTHILYIIYFLSIPALKKSLLKTAPYLGLLVAAYGLLLVYILFPSLGALKIPVIIYATVIMSMLLASIHIYYRVHDDAGRLFIAGALFFVLSDSLLAFNKFHTPIQFPFLIILTYCIAQYLIVRGFIKNSESNSQ
ncbi:MAG TPA: lysoplasmalogenase [Ferruginibacter sp.]|nr:lysoplasmalogenase [Ferruginibacter sp.]